MSIIRVEKEENYSVISNYPLQDERLSWKAKGLLVYLLSKPDDWKVYLNDLKKRSKDGRDSTSSGLKELQKEGYIRKEALRNDDGTFKEWEYIVQEYAGQPSNNGKPESGPERSKPTDKGGESAFTGSQSNNGLSESGLSNNGLSNSGKPDTTKYGNNQILKKQNTEGSKLSQLSFDDFDMEEQPLEVVTLYIYQEIKNFNEHLDTLKGATLEDWIQPLQQLIDDSNSLDVHKLNEVFVFVKKHDSGWWMDKIESTEKFKKHFPKIYGQYKKHQQELGDNSVFRSDSVHY